MIFTLASLTAPCAQSFARETTINKDCAKSVSRNVKWNRSYFYKMNVSIS